MSGSAFELDFFRIEKEKTQGQNLFHRRRSFRDIQSVVSKINPELLKSVMGKSFENGNLLASRKSFSVPSTPKEDRNSFPALPVYTPPFRPSASSGNAPESAPMTIFYNGTVAVFDVPKHKAENILKFAQEEGSKAVESTDSKLAFPSGYQRQLLETLNGDLPITRRKSLQRFLEKRKDRLTLVSPYGGSTDEFSGQNTKE